MGTLKENVHFSHLGKKGAGPQKSKIKSILGLKKYRFGRHPLQRWFERGVRVP